MKKALLIIIGAMLMFGTFSAEAKKKPEEEKKPDVYQFTMIKQVKTTPVKDQYKSGTCWSFSAISFIETELLRIGKPEYDLSEMFLVRTNYADKAKKFVRWHGSASFSGGGGTSDLLHTWRNYGLVPEKAYPGLDYGQEKHVHSEMDALLSAYVNTVLKNPNGKLSTKWFDGYNGILDAYLGKYPDKFEYEGKEYTPRSFADGLGLNPDDYVTITSFTHEPYYKQFVLDVPDNWNWENAYNVPLDDMIKIMDNSINTGYSVIWGGDVSDKGFQFKKQGLAVVLNDKVEDMTGSEIAKWDEIPYKEKQDSLYTFRTIRAEKVITPEIREKAYDSWETGDDHGMNIVGIAKDQNGNQYYYTKNSWNNDSNKYKGYLYMSVPYVRLSTTSIMVNKNAIPEDIRQKLNLK
jgi:bleomycin hydrolase